DNSTVRFGAHYDHRALKSWAVENEASRADVSRLAIKQVTPGRSALEPERLKSVKDAIESGAYLPPLDVRKTAEGYKIINGNHRLQAAIELKLENVPVIVRDAVGDVQASVASSVLQAPAPPRRNTI
ncbi:MAG: chromosome partitioning protein ParB, partial [Pseudomonas sp.]|nr:chromosome partitioning protein ParB [Pseudomonas sp.]